jgi:tRNA A-37 threonylcarbamoyl transferase component Bud32
MNVVRKLVREHEATMYCEFEQHGLTPKIISCNRLAPAPYWELVVERYDCELGEYIAAHPEEVEPLKACAHSLLHQLHTLGYVHGDPHPGNIVVKEGRLALIDFEETYLVTSSTTRLTAHQATVQELMPYRECEQRVQSAEHSMLDYWFSQL